MSVDWAKIDEDDLVQEIAQELRKLDKEERGQLLKKNALNKRQLIQGRHSRSCTIQMHKPSDGRCGKRT